METFLGTVAQRILDKYSDQLGEICIVTPNRRAWLYLRKHFQHKVLNPTWAPSFLSIEDFANKISGLQVLDSLSLLFEFYSVYKEEEGSKAADLQSFLHFGRVLLRDFDEAESSLADTAPMYQYFTQLEYINTWSPDGSTTAFQQRHLQFVAQFGKWHNALKNRLLAKQLAFQGMATRAAAQKLQSGSVEVPFLQVMFVGFNAFTQAEEAIITTLLRQNKAEVFFDSDPYYENNEKHEAGRFIRKYKKLWKIPISELLEEGFKNAKNINILGVSRSFLQAQLAANILASNPAMDADTSTAVVLANESLLIPMVSSLPKNFNNINITMGYPLRQTGIASLFEILFRLLTQKSSRTLSAGESTEYYFKDLVDLLSHPMAALLMGSNKGVSFAEETIRNINLSQQVFFTFNNLPVPKYARCTFEELFSFLETDFSALPHSLFQPLNDFCNNMEVVLQQKIYASPSKQVKENLLFELEAVKNFSALVFRLENLTTPFSKELSIESLRKIFETAMDEGRLPFAGEPLQGLQIMGMLETRSIDFKNIIILSVNDKTIPGAKNVETYIPFAVRQRFQLRLHYDREAIYAYHFYRLLQRAENIYLIYNTDTDGLGGSEKSRFATQLEFELPKYQPKTTIVSSSVAVLPKAKTTPKIIEIPKDESIMQRLNQIADTGFSPSSLSLYISCPLRFYFEKIIRMQKEEETEETIQANTIGSILHKTLEILYNPFVGKTVTPQDLEDMLQNAERVCIESISTDFRGVDFSKGKNLLLFSLIHHQLASFLSSEKKALENQNLLQLIGTEVKLKAQIEVWIGEMEKSVTIAGTADRIDMIAGKLRIIDYKSGMVNSSHLKVKSLNTLTENPDYSIALQLMLYKWMYCRSENSQVLPEAAVVSLKKSTDGLMLLHIPPELLDETENILDGFQVLLSQLLETILDPSLPIRQTENWDSCKFCPYKNICGRFSTD
ncbi:MAG TPA: hypothetical protein DCM62_05685 [Bacteroidales bacterium]|nr:hypothetical protein [Bacteroidales bacterium]